MTAPTALIADDEAHLAEHLRSRLAALWPEVSILPIAANGLEALRAIDDEAPTVAFLDIRMPGLTGLEVAHRMDRRTHVVFVTAYDQYAVDAFDRDAVDYLVKPIVDERLARTIERLRRRIADHDKPPALDEVLARIARALPATGSGRLRWIRASQGDTVRQIAVDDVLYFQAADKYTCVITGEDFWQVHRSTVVNMNAVASTRRDLGGRVFVKLKDGTTELAVSRAYAHLFKQM
jgi:DNA-binding LytR/AlgR family response regulator